jgi:hypothetical protein
MVCPMDFEMVVLMVLQNTRYYKVLLSVVVNQSEKEQYDTRDEER